jgi:Leucine-rich repeat (LRR) protein
MSANPEEEILAILDEIDINAEEINLEDHAITDLTPDIVEKLAQFPNLDRLDLSSNPFTELPHNFVLLKNLE